MTNNIGTLTENSLHAGIKDFLFSPGDLLEQKVDNFIVDIVRGDTLIEIQTHGFYKIRRKLDKLLDRYKIRLVYPIPKIKWIVRQGIHNNVVSRRKSPKKMSMWGVFQELIYIPAFLSHPNLVIEVLMIEQENILLDDGKGSWRRKGWSLMDQKLVQVIDQIPYIYPDDYAQLFIGLQEAAFRNAELARSLNCSVKLAQKITYTLSRTGLLTQQGKIGNANLFIINGC